MRVCTNCKIEKEQSQFAKRNTRLGHSSWCKTCGRNYYVKNRDKFLAEKHRLWIDEKETIQARNRYQYERTKEYRMIKSAKERAKQYKIPFNITEEDIKIPSHCPVLGIKLLLNHKAAKGDSPSLDRIIPLKGYVVDNIIVISQKANQIKNCATVAELKQVYEFFNKLEKSKL